MVVRPQCFVAEFTRTGIADLVARSSRPFRCVVSSAFQDDPETGPSGPEVIDRFVDLLEGERLADGCDVLAGCEIEHGERGRRAA